MSVRFGRIAATAAVLAALAPVAGASAAATLVSPAANGVVGSTPLFAWTPAPGETTEALTVSDSGITDSSGALSGSTKLYQAIAQNSYQTTAERAFYAGAYFWQVQTSAPSPEGYKTYANSVVQPFTIAPVVGAPRVTFDRYHYINKLDVNVSWSGNVERGVVTSDVFAGKRRLWHGVDVEKYGALGRPNTSYFYFSRTNRVKEGTKLRVVTKVTSGAIVRTTIKFVAAP